MKFLSVCSGIEAASVAWSPLGWKAVAFSEIEPFPCAVLAHHYPDTPNWGDMTKYKEWPDVSIDLLCGGTPCQSFSVAGLRKGLDDPRGNLMLTFGAIAAKYRPKWLVWENVPGVLSSNGGRDFGSFLGLLGVLGYGFAYRVLDAQYFGVAQRRRRVFVVGCLGDWRSAAAVLFERHSLSGHPAPRRQAGKGFTADAAPSLTASGRGVERTGETRGQDPVVAVPQVAPTLTSGPSSKASHGKKSGTDREVLIPVGTICVATGQAGAGIGAEMAPTLNCNHEAPYVAHSLRGEGFDASEDGTGRGTPLVPVAFPVLAFKPGQSEAAGGTFVTEEFAPTLQAQNNGSTAVPAIAIQGTLLNRSDTAGPAGSGISAGGVSFTQTKNDVHAVQYGMQVRRLTPEECEALQGFPTVSEKITIQACLDHQNQSVRVALKCLRWQNSVSHADENELTQPAKTADARSSTSPAHLAPLAALHVRMHSVDELLEIRSAGRLIWSASGAGQSRKSLPPTLTENSVQELARLLREVARTITAGKAESPPSIRLSFPASSGAINAEKSGREMEESASDAMSDQHRATFTTSDLGLITTFSDSTAETLSCFALHAIAGCIPSTTLPETFSIEMTVETPYTAIPWRGKPAADGPRYKALGNSWAVPNVRWIGERIDAVQAIKSAGRKAA